MIPALDLNKEEFHRKFPPGGNTASKPAASRDVNASTHPILNDIPAATTSRLVYKWATIQRFGGDSTYPIPSNDEFKNLRELKSLQAVVKQISVGNAVFSHMLVNPHDVLILFGDDFMKEMRDIQSDVKS